MTENWKDGAFEANSTEKQLIAFAMVMASLVLGGSAIASGTAPAAGALSVAYGATGVVKYLGFSLPPILRMLNVNAVAPVAAGIGAATMMTGQLDLTLLLLTSLHIIDFN